MAGERRRQPIGQGEDAVLVVHLEAEDDVAGARDLDQREPGIRRQPPDRAGARPFRSSARSRAPSSSSPKSRATVAVRPGRAGRSASVASARRRTGPASDHDRGTAGGGALGPAAGRLGVEPGGQARGRRPRPRPVRPRPRPVARARPTGRRPVERRRSGRAARAARPGGPRPRRRRRARRARARAGPPPRGRAGPPGGETAAGVRRRGPAPRRTASGWAHGRAVDSDRPSAAWSRARCIREIPRPPGRPGPEVPPTRGVGASRASGPASRDASLSRRARGGPAGRSSAGRRRSPRRRRRPTRPARRRSGRSRGRGPRGS